jgi:hypothetical protein
MYCIGIEYLDKEKKEKKLMKTLMKNMNVSFLFQIAKEYEKPENFDYLQYNFCNRKVFGKNFS